MPTVQPQKYEPEEILRIPLSGPGTQRCYVISGFADFTAGHGKESHVPWVPEGPAGDERDDYKWRSWNLHLTVGPEFFEVIDVSPTAGIAGFSFRDSDETDATGIELENCRWDTVPVGESNPGVERIRLKIKLRMCGGLRSVVSKISYHLVTVVSEPSVVG